MKRSLTQSVAGLWAGIVALGILALSTSTLHVSRAERHTTLQ
jgi:hypothetical protein